MKFFSIPKEREIQLDMGKLNWLGCNSGDYYWSRDGVGNFVFELKKASDAINEFSYGPVSLMADGKVKVPKQLNNYDSCAVRYLPNICQIWIGP